MACRDVCEVCGMVSSVPQLRGDTDLVVESDEMHRLLKRVARFAATDAPVVVMGETGTGKELVARVLHANSPRAARPFVAINVAALPAELLESELFGHGKGAFTGASSMKPGLLEAAHQGTLFLDEIGEMPLSLQAKLLRALQDGEVRRVGENASFAVDVRVVCATHRDLRSLVAAGSFREDLYYRLKVLSVLVPPLRERRADILPLARHFLQLEGAASAWFSAAAEAQLLAYSWPGNVRELSSAVRHGAALQGDGLIGVEELPDELHGEPSRLAVGALEGGLRSLAEVEREHIAQVMAAVGGSQTRAAQVLGIGRNTLWRKLRATA